MFDMKYRGLYQLVASFAILSISYVSAAPVDVVKDDEVHSKNTIAFDSMQAYWVFSGMVTNESGERFNYYFQMQRKEQHLHAVAMLMDSQTRKVLIFEHGYTGSAHFAIPNWRVGRIFLQFNPISNSWVFGVKEKANRGFNFKVDMLSQKINTPTIQDLRTGVELLVNQTGHLNGHLQTGETSKDQFVTAPKAWFKQMWVNKPQANSHPLTGVLCQFNDGSGFYSVNLQEADALRGAVAGWRNDEGISLPMSQFVSVHALQGDTWQIGVSSPKVHLSLENSLANENQNQLIAGLAEGKMPGFCAITKDEIG